MIPNRTIVVLQDEASEVARAKHFGYDRNAVRELVARLQTRKAPTARRLTNVETEGDRISFSTSCGEVRS